MSKKSSLLYGSFLSGVLVALAGGAWAQTKVANQNQLEEIVVTARKTSERLQTTPVAVTAITPQALERRQIKEVNDLVRATPDLSSNGGGTAPASIVYLSIRGNVQVSPNSASDSAVGIYVDGVYYGRPMIGNLGLLDMSGAEVLRGPQGTLFGRNTTGGALNLTTTQPTNRFEGYVKVGVGNYDQRLVEGVINMPLSNSLAARVVARYDERSGYITNDANNTKMNGVNGDYSVRGSLKWAPDDQPVEVFIAADYNKYKDNGTGAAVYSTTQAGGPPFGLSSIALWDAALQLPNAFGGQGLTLVGPNLADSMKAISNRNGFYHVNNATNNGVDLIDDPFNKNETKGINANVDVDLGEVHVKSITAYRESDTSNNLDLDGAPGFRPVVSGATYSWQPVTSGIITPVQANPGFLPGGPPVTGSWNGLSFFSQYKQRQVSEELQISGSVNKLEWITGLYGYVEKGTEESKSFQVTSFARDFADFRAQSLGAFAQVNYHFTDRLRGTAGFRYTWDTREITRHGGSFFGISQGAFSPVAGNAVYGNPDPANGPVGNTLCGVGVNAGTTYNAATCNQKLEAHFQYPAWLASLDYKITDDLFVYLKTSGAALSGGFNTRPAPQDSFNPEHVKDIELGLKADFLDKRLRTNVATFYMIRSGVQNQLNGFVGGRATQYVVNSGKIRAYGIEGEITALPWDGMELTAAGSYLHAKYASGSFLDLDLGTGLKYDRSGEPVLQSPKYTLNLGATQSFNMPWGKISIHGDYYYRSSEAIAFVTAPPSAAGTPLALAYAQSNKDAFLDGYGIFNARLTFNIESPDLEISFWGKNIGNKKYYNQMFNLLESVGYEERYAAPPRMYGATAAYHF